MTLREKINLYWKPVMGTLGAIFSGLYLQAILTTQPFVTAPDGLKLTEQSADHWTLANAYTTSVTVAGVTYTVILAKGFETDGASIPDDLQWPLGLSRISPSIIRGALVHDGLYAAELLDQATCDLILYAACRIDGTEPHKAAAIYRAVSDCGQVVWSRHTPESIARAREYVTLRRSDAKI